MLGKETVLDLFAGAGGLSEGFRQAGFRIVAGTDFDPDAAATYAANFPEAAVITGDLREPHVRERVLAAGKSASVVIGGPPCQAWSQVRNHSRMIDDPRNALYREFVKVVSEVLPRAFVMENVTGIDQMGAREQMLTDLAIEGEYVVSAQVLDAADFGVPQTRRRLVFIGYHRSIALTPPVVEGSGATSAIALIRREGAYHIFVQDDPGAIDLARALQDPSDATVVSAAQAISDLICLEAGRRTDWARYVEFPEPASAYQRVMRADTGDVLHNVQVPRINPDTVLRLSCLPAGGNHRDLPEDLLERYLTGQRWGQDNGTGRLSRRHFYAYRRLHPNIWAWTLNTKADAVYHFFEPRALSVREFARLQSFPDRFIVTTDRRKGPLQGRIAGGAAHSRYRQIGNAVPPLLARAIARAMASSLASAQLRSA